MKKATSPKVDSATFNRYFRLLREAQEKKQDLMLLYSEVRDIKKTSSFRAWQAYNKVLATLGKERKQLPNVHRPVYTEIISEDIKSEIKRYTRMLRRMNEELLLLQEVKRGIENSVYYRSLRKIMYLSRKAKKTVLNIPTHTVKRIFPYALRRRLKHQVLTVMPFVADGVSAAIQKEWDDWINTRKSDSCDIFIFGITAFGYRTQRPQHLARQLANKGHRVFYIENEFIPRSSHNWAFAPIVAKKQENNIFLIKLSCPRNLFIYSDKPDHEDLKVMFKSFKRLLYCVRAINPLAKIDHPFWGYMLDKIAMKVVYDCMDEHTGFKDNSDALSEVESKLIENASLVLASSSYLKKNLEKRKAKEIVMLPNAGEFEHFSRKVSESKMPEDIQNIVELGKPIVGYYGAIADWMDITLVEKAAKAFPNYSFVFIGRVMHPTIEALAKKLNNIFLLGEKLYETLPQYLQAFDVCTIPFMLTELIKATHPVKFFEYAATGKPIVTTALPELSRYKKQCYFASSHAEYLAALKKAVGEKDGQVKARIQIAKANTWDMRGQLLETEIKKLMFPKVSVIILSYNHAEMTIACLNSLLKRSFYPNLEIIVIDNASERAEQQKIKTYCLKYKLAFIANKTNEGFAKGNNQGLKKAKGTYLVLLNNDTVVTPGWAERLVFHSLGEDVGLVGPITNSVGNEMLVPLPYDKTTLEGMEYEALSYTTSHWGMQHEWKMLAAFCWLIPKHVYKRVGGLDENYGQALFEDDDYCAQLKRLGYRLIGTDDVFIHHYGSQSLDEIKRVEYAKLFERNKAYFEQKWDTVWIPHHLRGEKRAM